MTEKILVTPQELATHLNDENWIIFDCRHTLADPDIGQEFYDEHHIPGARFAHLERHLSAPASSADGRHPLPDEMAFIRWLGAQGVTTEHTVVAYDDTSSTFAARLWWMLKHLLGHEKVYLLDGGLPAWEQENLPQNAELPEISPATYHGKYNLSCLVTLEQLQTMRETPGTILVDVRGKERYTGEKEPLDPVAGHIPGAINMPFQGNVDDAGRFLPAETLKNRHQPLTAANNPNQVILYCGSGVTACHGLLGMVLGGLPAGRIYVGSWSQWCADASRPVATGVNS